MLFFSTLRIAVFSTFLLLATSALAIPNKVTTQRILFVGNSLTYYNDMPHIFRDYVQQHYPNIKIIVSMIAPGGEGFEGHRKNGVVRRILHAKKWDYVILQDQGRISSGIDINGVIHFGEPNIFLDNAHYFSKEIRKVNAVPVLYETWTAKIYVENAFRFIDYAYTKAAHDNNTLLAPVGRVWENLPDNFRPQLYDADGGHPSLYGSTVAAVTIAHSIFGEPKNTESIQVKGINADQYHAMITTIQNELVHVGDNVTNVAPTFTPYPKPDRTQKPM